MKSRLALLLVLGLVACAPSQLSRVALKEDLPSLERAIAKARAEGKLDRAELRDLAEAVATREITTAPGDEGVARIRDVRACASQLSDPLGERARGKDSVAAVAALALLELGKLDEQDAFEQYTSAQDPDWRAVGARAALGRERTPQRQRAFVDGDLRVRQAAFNAALAEPVFEDLTIALESARLDPDPMVRSLGIRLAGRIGGRHAVAGLRDTWVRAESEARQSIVDAWASPTSFNRGGQEQILWVMETERGLPAVVAAARLSAPGGPHRRQALAHLARVMDAGPVDEQRLSALMAPQAPELVEALEKLAKSEDAHAAVLAAAALARDPAKRAFARERLTALANHRQVLISRQARAALVVLGDQALVPKLKAELDSPSPERRRQAAIDLLRLERFADMASVLADPVARVRTQVACSVLSSR